MLSWVHRMPVGPGRVDIWIDIVTQLSRLFRGSIFASHALNAIRADKSFEICHWFKFALEEVLDPLQARVNANNAIHGGSRRRPAIIKCERSRRRELFWSILRVPGRSRGAQPLHRLGNLPSCGTDHGGRQHCLQSSSPALSEAREPSTAANQRARVPTASQVTAAWAGLVATQSDLNRSVRSWNNDTEQTWDPISAPGTIDAHRPPPPRVPSTSSRQRRCPRLTLSAATKPITLSTSIGEWMRLRLWRPKGISLGL